MSQVPATVVFGLHSIGCSEGGPELQTHPAEASGEEARVHVRHARPRFVEMLLKCGPHGNRS